MLRKLRRLSEFSGGELLVLIQLVVFASIARVGLEVFALPRISAFIAWGANQRLLRCLPLFQNNYEIEQLTRLADFAARAMRPNGPCLLRSLLLFFLLKAREEPAELLIGIRKEEGEFSSHAWIESGGNVFGDSKVIAKQFVTLLRF